METNPKGPARGIFCLYRGGGWAYMPSYVRTTLRLKSRSELVDSNLGFRVAMGAR